jgi:hypothetical protein
MDVATLTKMQAESAQERIKHETQQVTMLKTKLQFTIDDRHPLPKEWLRELLKIGDPFTITDLKTGEVLQRRDAHDNIASNVVQAD